MKVKLFVSIFLFDVLVYTFWELKHMSCLGERSSDLFWCYDFNGDERDGHRWTLMNDSVFSFFSPLAQIATWWGIPCFFATYRLTDTNRWRSTGSRDLSEWNLARSCLMTLSIPKFTKGFLLAATPESDVVLPKLGTHWKRWLNRSQLILMIE